MTARDQGGTQGEAVCHAAGCNVAAVETCTSTSLSGNPCVRRTCADHRCPCRDGKREPLPAPAGRPADEGQESEVEALALLLARTASLDEYMWPTQLARAVLAAGYVSPTEHERLVREARAEALELAADDIQALHPGEVKNSVIWLRDRAAQHRADKEPT